ncbi:MAG TPA: lipoate--protein ligase family protein, partial [Chlamydiales bacterium]|jgi:lipoate-protein ligase A|nr:lipoate--protein ligase family protein [Chlamydiales bacterium]
MRDSGTSEAEVNMAQDTAWLLDLDPKGLPILHFYDWAKPSATHGHFVDIKKYLNLEGIAKHGVALARRPTGGGIVFHIWDLAFSLLVPSEHPAFSVNTLDNYRMVNEVVLEAVVAYFSLNDATLIQQPGIEISPDCNHFCMARPTVYDAVFRGMKVAGAAQRRTKQGFLHQGTISLAFPQVGLLRDVLLSQDEVVRAMETYAFAPLGRSEKADLLRTARLDLKHMLHQKFLAKFKDMII